MLGVLPPLIQCSPSAARPLTKNTEPTARLKCIWPFREGHPVELLRRRLVFSCPLLALNKGADFPLVPLPFDLFRNDFLAFLAYSVRRCPLRPGSYYFVTPRANGFHILSCRWKACCLTAFGMTIPWRAYFHKGRKPPSGWISSPAWKAKSPRSVETTTDAGIFG